MEPGLGSTLRNQLAECLPFPPVSPFLQEAGACGALKGFQ